MPAGMVPIYSKLFTPCLPITPQSRNVYRRSQTVFSRQNNRERGIYKLDQILRGIIFNTAPKYSNPVSIISAFLSQIIPP